MTSRQNAAVPPWPTARAAPRPAAARAPTGRARAAPVPSTPAERAPRPPPLAVQPRPAPTPWAAGEDGSRRRPAWRASARDRVDGHFAVETPSDCSIFVTIARFRFEELLVHGFPAAEARDREQALRRRELVGARHPGDHRPVALFDPDLLPGGGEQVVRRTSAPPPCCRRTTAIGFWIRIVAAGSRIRSPRPSSDRRSPRPRSRSARRRGRRGTSAARCSPSCPG